MLYCTFQFPQEPTASYLCVWGGQLARHHHIAIYNQRSGDIVARFALHGLDKLSESLEQLHRRAIAQFARMRDRLQSGMYQDLDRQGPVWTGPLTII
ncbi:hypothetical protein ACTSKR_02935 [Chitinibacteraceae bacterium HSL-7]